MTIKDKLKIKLELINKQIEIYKKNAIQEIQNEAIVPATNTVAAIRDLKEQQLLIKQILEENEE